MTKVKIESTLSAAAEVAIEDLRGHLYAKPGLRIIAVVEFAHTERTEMAPDNDKASTVKLGVKFLEVGRGERQEEQLRKALAALKLQRTAYGTFDEELDELGLSESTLEQLSSSLAYEEMARLRAALGYEVDSLERILSATFTDKQRVAQIRKVLKVARTALKGIDGEAGD